MCKVIKAFQPRATQHPKLKCEGKERLEVFECFGSASSSLVFHHQLEVDTERLLKAVRIGELIVLDALFKKLCPHGVRM